MFPSDVELLSVNCDLSMMAIEDAVAVSKKQLVFTLHVSVMDAPFAKQLLREIGAITKDNVFASYINLSVDESLPYLHWYIEVDGAKVGSLGV